MMLMMMMEVSKENRDVGEGVGYVISAGIRASILLPVCYMIMGYCVVVHVIFFSKFLIFFLFPFFSMSFFVVIAIVFFLLIY